MVERDCPLGLESMPPEEPVGPNRSVTLTVAWRRLCAAIMSQAVKLDAGFSCWAPNNEMVEQRRVAREWLADPDSGVVTFKECCEALDVDAERAYRMISNYVHEKRGRAHRLRRPYDRHPCHIGVAGVIANHREVSEE